MRSKAAARAVGSDASMIFDFSLCKVASRTAAAVAAAVLGLTSSPPVAAAPALNGPDRQAISKAVGVASLDDAALWSQLVAFARVELGQRVRPGAVDRRWTVEPPPLDVEAQLLAAVQRGQLPTAIEALSPKDPQYRLLVQLRGRYARYLQAGWPSLAPGPTLRQGASGAAVAALRARLAAEGYGAAAAGEAFDAGLALVVGQFQAEHGLPADGVVGPATRAALNVSPQARLDQIEANLERRRWTPRDLPPERVEVDTSGATATFYRRGAALLDMRVIVGRPANPTPMFTALIDSIVFNPPWNVPAEIATKELWPKERRQPGYLQRNRFSVVQGRLVQAPGPGNALGALKFDFANPFGVYLHDTSAPQLFANDNRHLSHGCVRLEKPRDLAVLLLDEGGPASVETALASIQTERDRLPRKIPLFVQHWTVVVQPNGRPLFRPDVYGWDRKLAAALRAADKPPGAPAA
jgi:murein L,D-transpeptidase YcbB/YkuD